MAVASLARTLVVNFNSPELNQLALALARVQRLSKYIRPYVNKGRWWERSVEAIPWCGSLYGETFGRRRMLDPELIRLTREAGVLADVCAAGLGRMRSLPAARRQRWTGALHQSVRDSVANTASQLAKEADCVIAYEGFALPSFEAIRRAGSGHSVLNYPVAHHRHRRRTRERENELEPLFASTWPDFDDWPAGHEERLDDEIRLADAILVGSSFAANTFVAEGVDRAKMRVIPYGVDLETFHPPAESNPELGRFRVIYAGQLTQRKGLSYLLRGYQMFSRDDTELTLVGAIVGTGLPLLPYAPYFRHVPHQTRPLLARMYRRSDVFLFPTLVEGMPLVVLEAMACGLPVIVTANGPADLVRDGVDGFIIPDRDADAVCDRLDRLHRDRDLRIEMGRNAAVRARQFGWGAYTRNVLAALDDLSTATR